MNGQADGGDASWRQLDVRDPHAVEGLVESVASDMGGLDAVVNAAGIAVAGALEDTSVLGIQDQLDTNLLGAIYVTRAAVRHLRHSPQPRLIQISSIGGRIALPYQALYCASKFALEGLCDSLRYELGPQGIAVVLIEPGSVRTPLTANRLVAPQTDVYGAAASTALAINDRDEQEGVEPELVAGAVEHALIAPSPPARMLVGHWHERIALPAHALLPERLFRWITAAHYGIASSARKATRK